LQVQSYGPKKNATEPDRQLVKARPPVAVFRFENQKTAKKTGSNGLV